MIEVSELPQETTIKTQCYALVDKPVGERSVEVAKDKTGEGMGVERQHQLVGRHVRKWKCHRGVGRPR